MCVLNRVCSSLPVKILKKREVIPMRSKCGSKCVHKGPFFYISVFNPIAKQYSSQELSKSYEEKIMKLICKK